MRPSLHVCEKSASSGTYAQLNRQCYKTFCHKLSKFSAAKNPFHKIINTKDNLIQYVFSDYLWDLIFKNFKHFDRYGKILNKHPPPKKKKIKHTQFQKNIFCIIFIKCTAFWSQNTFLGGFRCFPLLCLLWYLYHKIGCNTQVFYLNIASIVLYISVLQCFYDMLCIKKLFLRIKASYILVALALLYYLKCYIYANACNCFP